MLEKKLARPFFVRLKVVFVADGEEVEDGVEFENGGIVLFLKFEGTLMNATGYIICNFEKLELTWRKAPSKGREIHGVYREE